MNTLNLATDQPGWETSPTRSTRTGKIAGTEEVSIAPALSNLRLRTVVAPFDFSDVSAALLRRLIALAEASDATVHVVHVVEPSSGVVAHGDTPIYPGARGCAWFRRHRLWSITDGILRHAPCPVLSVNASVKPLVACDETYSFERNNS
jgi:hypothetical protein